MQSVQLTLALVSAFTPDFGSSLCLQTTLSLLPAPLPPSCSSSHALDPLALGSVLKVGLSLWSWWHGVVPAGVKELQELPLGVTAGPLIKSVIGVREVSGKCKANGHGSSKSGLDRSGRPFTKEGRSLLALSSQYLVSRSHDKENAPGQPCL